MRIQDPDNILSGCIWFFLKNPGLRQVDSVDNVPAQYYIAHSFSSLKSITQMTAVFAVGEDFPLWVRRRLAGLLVIGVYFYHRKDFYHG